MEPSHSHTPVSFYGFGGDFESLGGFFRGESGEEVQFYYLALSLVELTHLSSASIDLQQIVRSSYGSTLDHYLNNCKAEPLSVWARYELRLGWSMVSLSQVSWPFSRIHTR